MGTGATGARGAGEAVIPIPLTVHSFPVKEVQLPGNTTPYTEDGRPELRVALYARMLTSSSRRTQPGLDEQLRELRGFAARRAWTVVAEYAQEHESGKHLRKQFHKMFDAAEKCEFDTLIFCSFENSRQGLPLIEQLQVKKLLDVGWRSNRLLRELPQFYRAVFG